MSFPISMPDSCSAAQFTLTLQHIVGVSESDFTFEDNVFRWQGVRWNFSFQLPNITQRAIAEEWFCFAAKLGGRYGTFLAGDPGGKVPRGLGGGSPVVDGANQTGDTLDIRGAAPNVDGWLEPGDYIQVGTGAASRLYKALATADTDGGGNVTIPVTPILRPNMADGAVITLHNAKGVFRLDDNDIVRTQQPGLYRFGFTASEVV